MTNYIKIYFKSGEEIVEQIDDKSICWKESTLTFINEKGISIWLNLNEITEIRMWNNGR